ncbi:MAG: T9SS type A sorting domain-containing protein [Ignavibacteria bacterium]|nr:T9SS type A sorting domain-containing protein [Ignavibacteria bacterium]
MCLLLVIALLLITESVQAQPFRAWKRDQHWKVESLRFDDKRNLLYTYGGNFVDTWDTKADTLVKSTPLTPTRITFFGVLNDSLLYAELDSGWCGIFNFITGEQIQSHQWNSALTWIDRYGNAIVRRIAASPQDDTIEVIDPLTLERRFRFTWAHPQFNGEAYDKVRNILYGIGLYELLRVQADSSVDTLAFFNDKNSRFFSLDVLDDGRLLLYQYQLEPRPLQYVRIYDPQLKEFTDSLDIGTYYNTADSYITNQHAVLRDGYRALIRTNRDTTIMLSLSPLQIVAKIPGPDSKDSYTTNLRQSPFIYVSSTLEYLQIDESSFSSISILPSRTPIVDIGQLSDGRIAALVSRLGIVEIDRRTGETGFKIWPNVSTEGVANFLVSPTMKNVVVNYYNQILQISTINGDTFCRLTGENNIHPTQYGTSLIGAEWISSDGNQFIMSYNWEMTIQYTDFKGVDYFTTTSPCSDNRNFENPLLHGIVEGIYTRNGPRKLAVNTGGNLILAPVNYYTTSEVWMFNCLDGVDCKSRKTVVFPGRTAAVILPLSEKVIMDDSAGLIDQDAADSALSTVIDLGQRFLPLTSMNTSNTVLGYADSKLHAVNVDSKTIEWSIPIRCMPLQVLVDKNDRWFIIDCYQTGIEMYYLDPALGVNESNIPGTLSFYPNPFSSTFTISGLHEDAMPLTVTVLNTLGNIVRNERFYNSNGQIQIDASSLANGTYMILVMQDSNLLGRGQVVLLK